MNWRVTLALRRIAARVCEQRTMERLVRAQYRRHGDAGMATG